MKKLLIVGGIVAVAVLIGYQAFGHSPGWGWGRGNHMQGYWGSGPHHGWQYGRNYQPLTEEERNPCGRGT